MNEAEFEREAARLGRNEAQEAVAGRHPVDNARSLLTRAATEPAREAQAAMATRAIGWLLLHEAETRIEVVQEARAEDEDALTCVNARTTEENDAQIEHIARVEREAYNRGYDNAEEVAGNTIERLNGELDTARTKLADIQAAVDLFNNRTDQFDTTWDRIEEVLGR